MTLSVKYFGSLADLTCKTQEEMPVTPTLKELKALLIKKYPGLVEKTFLFSANKKIVNESIELKAGDEIALLPPFSGG